MATEVDYNASLDNPELWRYAAAAGLTVGLNVVAYWVPVKYIFKEDYADISWDTVKQNFETGFVVDNDFFKTNQFGHPLSRCDLPLQWPDYGSWFLWLGVHGVFRLFAVGNVHGERAAGIQ